MKAIRCPAGPPKAVKLKIKTCFRKLKLDDLNYDLVKVKFAITIIMAFIQISCNVGLKQNILYNYDIQNEISYDRLNNWAAHPQKIDYSDSVSAVFEGNVNLDLCDIFYLHPTSFTDKKWKHISNASLLDTITNKKTDESGILYQASVFNEVGRIYAPRYRQAHIERYYDTTVIQKKAFDFAYEDVKSSFTKYLEKWNEGRNIIIIGHSQGTTHALRLIKEMVDGHEIANRIVYVYLIGMPVLKNEFSVLEPCTNDSTNFCFVSWRTYRNGYEGKYTNRYDTTIQVNNPVDINAKQGWTGLHKKKRSILWNYNVGYKKTHDTRIMGDMLWITRPKFKGGLLGIFMKNYHAGDINLFYEDIRDDIKKRLVQIAMN